jgi:D-arginine dehydrogenase
LQEEFEPAGRSTRVSWLGADEVETRCPLLRPAIAQAGFLEPDALDLDSNALLQGFARSATRNGAVLHTSAPIQRIAGQAGNWRVSAGEHEISCAILVDAAGAWADRVAVMAGVPPCGMEPRRRTAATLPVPAEQAGWLAKMPFVSPVDGSFYFKPEAGTVMVSLSDETPSDPCDAYPDDIDVATALERFHEATIVPRARPTAAWAGLRTLRTASR